MRLMSIDAENLRKIARDVEFLEDNHREALFAAAAEIDRLEHRLNDWRHNHRALSRALVGDTGLSAIEEAHRLRKLHPLERTVHS